MLTEREIADYLDNALSPADRKRFEKRLTDHPEIVDELSSHRRLDQALRVLLADPLEVERLKRSVLATIDAKPIEDLKNEVLETARDRDLQTPGPAPLQEPSNVVVVTSFAWARAVRWIGFAAAACLAFTLWLVLPSRDLGRFTALHGDVRVSHSGSTAPARENQKLFPGDTLHLGLGASAAMSYRDSTRLSFESDTQAAFSNGSDLGKGIELTRGAFSARVTPQPAEHPMTVKTSEARLVVVGTSFRVEANLTPVIKPQTRLEVMEGRVRFESMSSLDSVEVAAGQTAVANPGTTPVAMPLERNAVRWPFTGESPWNRPIGNAARYEPVNAPGFNFSTSLKNAVLRRPVFLAFPGLPEHQIVIGGNSAQRVPFSDAWIIPPASDPTTVVVIDPEKNQITEMKPLRRIAGNKLETMRVAQGTLNGEGLGTDWQGVVDYGGSALGGVVRPGELTAGIRHALALNLPKPALSINGTQGKPFVWPATRGGQDLLSYSRTGNLHMGTLLAIPPAVNLADLGLGTTGPGIELARAMQDYGAYITESAIPVFKMIVAGEAMPPDIDLILSRIVPHLKVIINNGPGAASGGGTPRRANATPAVVSAAGATP